MLQISYFPTVFDVLDAYLFTVYYGRTLKPPWLYHKFQKVSYQSGELKQ